MLFLHFLQVCFLYGIFSQRIPLRYSIKTVEPCQKCIKLFLIYKCVCFGLWMIVCLLNYVCRQVTYFVQLNIGCLGEDEKLSFINFAKTLHTQYNVLKRMKNDLSSILPKLCTLCRVLAKSIKDNFSSFPRQPIFSCTKYVTCLQTSLISKLSRH